MTVRAWRWMGKGMLRDKASSVSKPLMVIMSCMHQSSPSGIDVTSSILLASPIFDPHSRGYR